MKSAAVSQQPMSVNPRLSTHGCQLTYVNSHFQPMPHVNSYLPTHVTTNVCQFTAVKPRLVTHVSRLATHVCQPTSVNRRQPTSVIPRRCGWRGFSWRICQLTPVNSLCQLTPVNSLCQLTPVNSRLSTHTCPPQREASRRCDRFRVIRRVRSLVAVGSAEPVVRSDGRSRLWQGCWVSDAGDTLIHPCSQLRNLLIGAVAVDVLL